jgi:tetratricopeptide (TPR) repeat protein
LRSADYRLARRHFEESLRVSRDISFANYESGVLASIGYLELEEGNLEGAKHSLMEGLRLALDRGLINGSTAHDLYIFGQVIALQGDYESACVLVGACDEAFDLIGLAREPTAEGARNEVLGRAPAEIGWDAVEGANLRGKTYTLVDAVRYALALEVLVLDEPLAPAARRRPPS